MTNQEGENCRNPNRRQFELAIDSDARFHKTASNALELLRRLESHPKCDVSTLILLKSGTPVCGFFRDPYKNGTIRLLYSLTKTFTAITAGIAVDHGYFSLGNSAISFFPDKVPDVISENLRNMTVHHLLSMTTGRETPDYNEIYPNQDWVKAFLNHR